MIWSSSSRPSGGWAWGRAVAGWAACAWLLGGAAVLRAHVPVPASVLDPKTPAEAWNVIRLTTDNAARLLREGRLAEIPDQISLCSPALRALPNWVDGAPDGKRRAAVAAVRAAAAVGSLAQAGAVGDRATAAAALGSLRGHLDAMATAFDPAAVRADIFACPMHPDCVSADPAARCPKCGMGLLPRRIPYSFVYVPDGAPSLRLTALCPPNPGAGRPWRVSVRIARGDGSPVASSDLLVLHTQPIHLLIVDPALGDYHHEHPVPTGTPGEYAFSFTPGQNGGYRVFADLVPAETGVQELPYTDLPGTGPSPAVPLRETDTFAATAGGLCFRLTRPGASAGPIRAGQVCALRIAVSDEATGQPVTALEPVMGAFAHLVGFYDDHRTVVHLHPLGEEAAGTQARGGPALEFKFYPPKPGFIRLYCQVQSAGKAIFAPFDLHVAP